MTMYLARLVAGSEPQVYEVQSRSARAWRFAGGVAVIRESPASATGTAMAMVDEQRFEDRRQERRRIRT